MIEIRRPLVAALLFASASAGCSDQAATTPPDLGADLGAPPDLSPGPRSSYTADEAAAARTACTFKSGTLPGLSVAKDALLGADIPIDTVVIIMMENRSFDNLLGNLVHYGQPDADVAPDGVTNLDQNGDPVARYHFTDYCFDDTAHSWSSVHQEIDGGKMDKFVVANAGGASDPLGHRAMGYFTEADIPYLYALADTFAIGDRYFCDVPGSTQPNRDYLYAATSYGRVSNDIFTDERYNVMELLTENHVPWHEYWETRPPLGIFIDSFTKYLNSNTDRLTTFFDDAAAGKLASVVFVDPDLSDSAGGAQDDFHPEGDLQLGQQFVAKVVNALIRSPQWPRMAVFLTFDEHGGQYDHVPPPSACVPDDIEPAVMPPDPTQHFDRYGVRVPFVVISPWARPHYVSHTQLSHASILRFVETRFVLPAMTARDANSNVPLDLFDFSGAPPLLTPPALPDATVDSAQATACAQRFPRSTGD